MIGMYVFMLSSLLILRKAVEISHTRGKLYACAGLDFIFWPNKITKSWLCDKTRAIIYIINWSMDFFVYDGQHIFYIITKNGMTWGIENWEKHEILHFYLLYQNFFFLPPSFPSEIKKNLFYCFSIINTKNNNSLYLFQVWDNNLTWFF